MLYYIFYSNTKISEISDMTHPLMYTNRMYYEEGCWFNIAGYFMGKVLVCSRNSTSNLALF